MTDSQDYCRYVSPVQALASEAGRRILDVYERRFGVEAKGDGSPLTEADRAAHQAITSGLSALTPSIPVLSEESASVEYGTRTQWKRFWLVDPLDGTKEFVDRQGEFTVNIALVEGARPVLGVVYMPLLALTYYACRGQGAFKHKAGEKPVPIQARRYDGGKPIVVASRLHAGARLADFLKSLGEHDLVRVGSALKFCLVAEGTADVYPRLGPTMEWDTAAAQCIVEQAGGRVQDANRQPLVYNKPTLLNPWFMASAAGDYNWWRHLPSPST